MSSGLASVVEVSTPPTSQVGQRIHLPSGVINWLQHTSETGEGEALMEGCLHLRFVIFDLYMARYLLFNVM